MLPQALCSTRSATVIRSDRDVMAILATVRSLRLLHWWLVAGFYPLAAARRREWHRMPIATAPAMIAA
jgi:hypothetical protein